MTPTYLHSLHSPSSPLEQNEAQALLFSSPSQASSSSSLSCPIYFSPSRDQTLNYDGEQPQLEASKDVLHGGSSDHEFPSSSSIPSMENNIDYDLKFSMIWKHDENKDDISPSDGSPSGSGSVKWMSSKMRLMKKMMNSSRVEGERLHKFQNQKIKPSSNLDNKNCSSNSSSNGNNNIRVCSDCNTTKTPLWRSGPRGPKSLCNACGIRQRKARRAMAATSAIVHPNETTITKQSKVMNHKEKRSGKGYNITDYKKRCKLTTSTPRPGGDNKLCFEDFTISLMSKNSAFHRVFPQDEKEAAILLMALSCGLVHG